jgi:hypothetical protein
MESSITKPTYKDQQAISLNAGKLRAQFLPSLGAKLCSLVYLPRDLELLVQRPGTEYLLQPYDGNYVAGECSGFDDMFPSIDACHYEDYPWKGTRIPDHGEVWSLPWDCSVEGDRLHFATHGIRFPYRLEKWVSASGPSALRLDYRLTNLTGFDFSFIWAAHIMLNLEEGARLELPSCVERVVNALNLGKADGRYGDELPWPTHRQRDGSARDLRQIRPKDTREATKYWIKGPMPEGWCALAYPASKISLTISFSTATVPYLGILINEGGWRDMHAAFVEPATGSFDRIDLARLRGELSAVGPRGSYEWHLEIAIRDLP